MRVLELIHELGVGGAEHVVADLARQLRARGHHVELACLDGVGTLGESLLSDGFLVRAFHRRPGFDAPLPLRLARHAREARLSVLHAHQHGAFFYGVLAALRHGLPIVYTEHGRLDWQPGRRSRIFNRVLGRRADAVTVVSPAVRQHLVEVCSLRTRDPIELLPNGVDTARFRQASPQQVAATRAELGVAPGTKVMGTAGRLVAVKSLDLMLQAFATLEVVAELWIVGDGEQRPVLEALAADLGIASRVRFLGLRNDVERLLPALDLYCSTSTHEAMPLSLLEAGACQLPIVATAVGGVPAMFEEGTEIALLPPPSAGPAGGSGREARVLAQLGTTLDGLLRDEDRRRQMGEAARRRVVRDYDLTSVASRYAEILEHTASLRS